MRRIIHYLFPNDWVDMETIRENLYSRYTGDKEGVAKVTILQRSPSTGRYRKQSFQITP